MEGLIKGRVYNFIFYIYTKDKTITHRLSARIFIGLSNEKNRDHIFRKKKVRATKGSPQGLV